jgi:hypothetical protein
VLQRWVLRGEVGPLYACVVPTTCHYRYHLHILPVTASPAYIELSASRDADVGTVWERIAAMPQEAAACLHVIDSATFVSIPARHLLKMPHICVAAALEEATRPYSLRVHLDRLDWSRRELSCFPHPSEYSCLLMKYRSACCGVGLAGACRFSLCLRDSPSPVSLLSETLNVNYLTSARRDPDVDKSWDGAVAV